MTPAIYPPLTRTFEPLNSWPILAVLASVFAPKLRAVSLDNSRSAYAVKFAVDPPLACPILAHNSWPVATVELTVFVPKLRPVSLNDCRIAYAVKFAIFPVLAFTIGPRNGRPVDPMESAIFVPRLGSIIMYDSIKVAIVTVRYSFVALVHTLTPYPLVRSPVLVLVLS
jgi:hypothetical protein